MLIYGRMKILLIGILILGWSTSDFTLSTGNWILGGVGLVVVGLGGALYKQPRHGSSSAFLGIFATRFVLIDHPSHDIT